MSHSHWTVPNAVFVLLLFAAIAALIAWSAHTASATERLAAKRAELTRARSVVDSVAEAESRIPLKQTRVVSEGQRHGVWASLTTTPTRLAASRDVIERWDLTGVDGVLLHVPDVFARDGTAYPRPLPWSLPRVFVHRCGVDDGPLTKWTGAALLLEASSKQRSASKEGPANTRTREPVESLDGNSAELAAALDIRESDTFVVCDDDVEYGQGVFLNLAADAATASRLDQALASAATPVRSDALESGRSCVVLGTTSVRVAPHPRLARPQSTYARPPPPPAFLALLSDALGVRATAASVLEGWMGIAVPGYVLSPAFVQRTRAFVRSCRECFNSDDVVVSAALHEAGAWLIATNARAHVQPLRTGYGSDALHAQHWSGHALPYLRCASRILALQDGDDSFSS
jgi:hypothetical protein